MARTALTVQTISVDGLTPSYTAGDATNDHEFANDGNVFLHIKNTGGSAIVVTVVTPATVNGLAVADVAVTVPATSGDKMIGPFDTGLFNQAGGVVHVDLPSAVGLTLAAIKLP